MSQRATVPKRSAGFPERVSKAATLAAIALALPLQLLVDPAVGIAVRILAPVVFGIALFCGHWWGPVTIVVVVAAGAVMPALLTAALHVAALNAFYSVWLAAVFGAILPLAAASRWHFPRDWRIPLGVWALTLAFSWPVMIARETGLRLASLRDTGTVDTWAGLNTPQVESWILHVVLTQLVALLWLEWIFRSDDSSRAAHGLWIGASLASLVAVYQGTVDATFLSGGPWPALRRAAGTLVDANAYGTIAAIAGPLAFVSIPHLRLRHGRTLQVGALVLNWAGAWMSGSRTALLCGAFGTALLCFELVRGGRRDARERALPAWLAAGALVVLLLAIGASAIGPVGRIAEGLGPGTSFRQLWSRGGYGTVATRMISDHPFIGVGVGSFNWMAPDYWRMMTNETLPFDNAQNWWRHQVAELGIVASLPIILWSLLVAWLVVSRRSPPDARLEGETLRGLILGIGAASLVGMPTQNPVVLLMFFYVVGRFDLLTRPPIPRVATPRKSSTKQIRQIAWAAGVLLAVAYTEGHLALARGPLDPVERAAAYNRDYVIGSYPPEPQSNGEFRWTGARARFLLRAPSRYLVVRYRVEHPDVEDRPVNVQISTPCQLLVDEFRSDSNTVTAALELEESQKAVEFSTEVSRTWRPSESGLADNRNLGVAIETAFVTTPEEADATTKWTTLLPCG